MKVIGLMPNEKIHWKKFSCTCDGKMEKCKVCKYTIAQNSIPKKDFFVKQIELDKKGKPTGKIIDKKISEITIVRGSDDDVQGWKF